MYIFFYKRWKIVRKILWNLEKKSAKLSKKNLAVNLYTNEKYLKTKIKSYNGTINTNFHNNKISKEVSQCICLSVILINSVYREDKDNYPQAFLEQYKYLVKEKKTSNFINVTSCYWLSCLLMILIENILMKKLKYRI